ncbi:MAG: site-specific integrase [Dehalococcoidales bacterium]|nr:site-specific integrase [Dehalococcoidales bacterium]
MAIGEYQNIVHDLQVMRLIDDVLVAVGALKAHLEDSNMDSNSIGGILIPRLSPYNIPMGNRPRTKALGDDQLKGELKGDLAAYEEFGLFQRSVNQNTAYRYRGVLLRYQQFLGQNLPSLAASVEYLSSLRKNDFDPSTLRLYRAAIAGFHQWRNEELKFRVKVPRTSAKYIPWETIPN